MIGTVSNAARRPFPPVVRWPLMLCSMLHNCPWTATATEVNPSGKAPLNRYVTSMDPSGRSPATDARNAVTDFARLIRRPRWAPPTIDRALQLLMLIALLPAALLIVHTLVQGEIHARDDAYDKVAILARITAEKAEVVLDQNQAMLQRLAERRLVRLLDPDLCDPLIDTFVALHRTYTNIGIRDLRANSVCSHIDNPPAQADVARFPWFVEGIRSGDFTVGDAFLGRPSGRWLSVLTYPIRAADGNVAGLVVFSMDLLKAYRRVMGAPSTAATVALVDRNNAVLMRSADLEGWIGKPFLASFNGIPDAVQTAAEGRFPAVGNDGKRWLYSFVTVKGTGWRVFAGLPEDAVLAEHRLQQAYTIALWLCALALGLAATWVVGRYIARPIHRLAETTRKIASGETSARAEIAGPREIEEVVNDFNHMLDVRAQHREEKAALVTRNDQLVQLARDIFLLIAPDGHVVDGNDAAIAAYGYTREEFRHLDVSDLRPPSHRDSMPAQWNAAAQPGGTLFETVHQRKDGTTFPVEISSQVVTIDGQPYRQSFVRDISARKETERKAREAHEHLRMLTTRLSEVRERETARLAREIHDELGQRLTGLAMEITWLASRLDQGTEGAARQDRIGAREPRCDRGSGAQHRRAVATGGSRSPRPRAGDRVAGEAVPETDRARLRVRRQYRRSDAAAGAGDRPVPDHPGSHDQRGAPRGGNAGRRQPVPGLGYGHARDPGRRQGDRRRLDEPHDVARPARDAGTRPRDRCDVHDRGPSRTGDGGHGARRVRRTQRTRR